MNIATQVTVNDPVKAKESCEAKMAFNGICSANVEPFVALDLTKTRQGFAQHRWWRNTSNSGRPKGRYGEAFLKR